MQTTAEQDLQQQTEAPLPPLRIHHFLVWMAVVAVVFSLNRFANSAGAGYFLEETSG